VENECEPSPSKVIELVAQYGSTAYDGQFIAVALEMGIPFVTRTKNCRKIYWDAVCMDEFLKPEFGHVVREVKTSYSRSKV